MIALMNALGLIIIFIGGFLTFHFRSWKIAVATIVVLLVYTKLQPSYIPKGTVERMPVIQSERITKPMEDRMLKAKPAEQRDAERKAEYDATDKRMAEAINKYKADNAK